MTVAGIPSSTITGLHRNTERQQQVKGEKSLKDDFMKIFLTQMLKQNPMKPNDSSMMMQQMGQLTALQSTEDLQKAVKQLTDNLGKSQLLTAAQLVGRQVQVPNDLAPLIRTSEADPATGAVVEKGTLKGSVILSQPATNITITIKDTNTGLEVAKINKGDSGAGILDFDWDGIDKLTKELGTGEFYHISATGSMNGLVTVLPTNGSFVVNSVTMDPRDKHTVINLDGAGGTDLGSVIKII